MKGSREFKASTRIESGYILVYRVFDIAEEVDLTLALQTLGQVGSESRLDLSTRNRTAVIVRNAPIRFNLETSEIHIAGQARKVEVTATLWDYGALSIQLQIPMTPKASFHELVSLSALINADEATVSTIDRHAKKCREQIVKMLGRALKGVGEWSYFEDYIVYFIERIDEAMNAKTFTEQNDISALILGEVRDELSQPTRESILENTYQYAEDDLVIVDWNSALVIEPSGEREIVDVLEFALSQLLEVRYYDDLIDKRLASLYDSIERDRSRLFQRKINAIAKEANTRFIEISEFNERMSNSLKFVGDFYLARIYRGALKRFRILDWQDAITRKMNGLARVSELLQGEANTRRSHLLEVIIVILILFEIISPFLWRHP